MKTIYLKASTLAALIADISTHIDFGENRFNGEIEFSNGIIFGHYIGQIPDSIDPQNGQVLAWKDGYHANLLVPENFDESQLKTIATPPSTPAHQFA